MNDKADSVSGRPTQISVRVSDDERKQISRRAADEGLATGAFIRAQCLGTKGYRSGRHTAVDLIELRQCMADMGRMSLNLHDLYRIAALGEIPAREELERACGEHRAILARLMVALGKKP